MLYLLYKSLDSCILTDTLLCYSLEITVYLPGILQLIPGILNKISIHIEFFSPLTFPFKAKPLQSSAVSNDRQTDMPWCQSCLQVTLFAGSNNNKLASVRGCQTECHRAGSTAAGDVIKVAAKLAKKKKAPENSVT